MDKLILERTTNTAWIGNYYFTWTWTFATDGKTAFIYARLGGLDFGGEFVACPDSEPIGDKTLILQYCEKKKIPITDYV